MIALVVRVAVALPAMQAIEAEPRQAFPNASDAALFVDAERWIDDDMLSATCGKHDSPAIAALKRDRRRLQRLEAFVDRNHQLAPERARRRALDSGTASAEGICIPESRPEEEVRMVDRMIRELDRRADEAGAR